MNINGNQSLNAVQIANVFKETIASLIVIIYSLLTMIFVTGLLIYHIKLTCKNITTKENLKGLYQNAFGNPYDR